MRRKSCILAITCLIAAVAYWQYSRAERLKFLEQQLTSESREIALAATTQLAESRHGLPILTRNLLDSKDSQSARQAELILEVIDRWALRPTQGIEDRLDQIVDLLAASNPAELVANQREVAKVMHRILAWQSTASTSQDSEREEICEQILILLATAEQASLKKDEATVVSESDPKISLPLNPASQTASDPVLDSLPPLPGGNLPISPVEID